jgi:hypothetical protein
MTGKQVGKAGEALGMEESLYRIAGLNVRSNLSQQGLPIGDRVADVNLLIRKGKANVRNILRPIILRRSPEGEEIFTHFLTSAGYYLRYELVEFTIAVEGVINVSCYPKLISPELIWGIFTSDVMTYILVEKEIDALHGSAVALDGSGVAFVGHPGSGKSTLTAYFLKKGFPLLADDRLPFAISKEGVLAIPNFPGMRISEDVGRYIFTDAFEKLSKLHVKCDKRFFCFTSNGCESGLEFQADPVPLKRIYILGPDSDDISLGSLSPRDAFLSLVPHIFDSRKSSKNVFYNKCALAQLTQVRLLSFPRRLHLLPELFRIIKEDCEVDTSRVAEYEEIKDGKMAV